MRGGRSHRLPSNEPHDDWGDGSWTVDCVCGVNFDDGEEMVNCDECGVWVHTRCSHFVKGETSFACDKCKRKKNKVDNEETEVARLLVELPTKSMKMETSVSSSIPSWSSVRLWTDIPIEERVHVHGVSGGDPTLFQGMPSIFSHELWRCTGYVAKKFNFQYREFPCWDELDKVDVEPLEAENPLDKGANTLFSLSKVAATNSMDMVVGRRGSIEGDPGYEKPFLKEIRKQEGKRSSVVRMQNNVKRDRNHARSLGPPLGKQKSDDLAVDKDEGMTKKANCFDKGVCGKKKVATLTTEARKVELVEDECLKVVEPDNNDLQNGVNEEAIILKSESDYYDDACEENLMAKANNTGHSFKEVSECEFRIGTVTKSQKFDSEVHSGIECDSITPSPSPLRPNDIGCPSAKEEDFDAATDHRRNLGDLYVSSSTAMEDFSKLKHPIEDLLHASTEVKDGQILCNQKCGLARSLTQPNIEQNVEDTEQFKPVTNFLCSSYDVVRMDTKRCFNHHEEISAAHSYKNLNEIDVASCPLDKSKTQIVESEQEAVSHYNKGNPVKEWISVCGEPCENDQGNDSLEAIVVRRSSSDPELELTNAEPLRAEGLNHSSVVSISGSKHVLSNGKTSTSSSVVCPRSANLGCCRPASPNTKRFINSSKQCVEVNSSSDSKKEHIVSEMIRDDGRHETAKKTLKEQPKGSLHSRLKSSELSKGSHVSATKRMLSDSKLQALHPSSKSIACPNVGDTCGSGESANSLQTAQQWQNKPTSTGLYQKGERSNHSGSQHSSKINLSSSGYPNTVGNTSLTLSDEELALLLHQELNSSPRVPRVPRVRQAGIVPPMASAAAASMLVKRTSSHGGKDQVSVSRRKSKEDSLKDSIRSCERTDMTKRVGKTLLSSDNLSHEPISEGSTKNEIGNRSFEAQLSQKNKCINTTIVASPSTIGANDQNLLLVHNSTMDVFDNGNEKDGDNTCRSGGSVSRTLPGLIDEILSRGNNVSCRELCDAVLPHWDDLRKLNGERYAYSSHSQAVLDCLRNRNEWAQLVDRGPKTNAGKKRRKHDAELPVAEVDGKEHNESTSSQKLEGKNVESHQEDFPKGKRKARKRRRLALKGRGINDVRRRQITEGDECIDNDVGPFSHSSDEGAGEVFSEDEIQDTRRHSVGSEAASSSDEAGSV